MKQPNLSDTVHLEVDKIRYAVILDYVQGHQTQAADLLGISRTTLRARMQTLGIVVAKTAKSSDE